MNTSMMLAEGFSRWIDEVAAFVVSMSEQFAAAPAVKLMEVDNGEFSVSVAGEQPHTMERIRIVEGEIVGTVSEAIATTLRDSRIELTLKPERFLFRPLELPGRAAEFLGGIIRSQIDRLTPWNAPDAVFGWATPNQAGADRLIVTVAATARSLVAPLVQAIARLGVQSIVVFTKSPEQTADGAAIKVMEERPPVFSDVDNIRQLLIVVLAVTAAVAVAAVSGSTLIEMSLDTQKAELDHRIAKIRSAANMSGNSAAGSLAAAQHILETRKHTAPSSVMIIEALSRILPDHTYVTELRIQDNRVQLVGLTDDAPSLVGLLEQSGLFARATFFAPTTRSPSDPRQRFHIEAVIQPAFAVRS